MAIVRNLADIVPHQDAHNSPAEGEPGPTGPIGPAGPVGDVANSRLMHPGYRSGQWYGNLPTASPLANLAIAADTLYAQPTSILFPCTLTQLSLGVGTAVVGALARLAIYNNDDVNMRPGTLVAVCSGECDLNLTAATAASLSFASSIPVNAGMYWLCSVFNTSTGMPYTMQANNVHASGINWYTGSASAMGPLRGGTSPTSRVTTAMLYTDPFPQVYGAATFGTGSPGNPVVAFRVQ